jgi:hypothetical protein
MILVERMNRTKATEYRGVQVTCICQFLRILSFLLDVTRVQLHILFSVDLKCEGNRVQNVQIVNELFDTTYG